MGGFYILRFGQGCDTIPSDMTLVVLGRKDPAFMCPWGQKTPPTAWLEGGDIIK